MFLAVKYPIRSLTDTSHFTGPDICLSTSLSVSSYMSFVIIKGPYFTSLHSNWQNYCFALLSG